jgi:hypothetical protein
MQVKMTRVARVSSLIGRETTSSDADFINIGVNKQPNLKGF